MAHETGPWHQQSRTARDHCPYLGHRDTNQIPKVGPDVPAGRTVIGRSVTTRGQRRTTVPTFDMAIQMKSKVGPDVPAGRTDLTTRRGNPVMSR